MQGNPPRVTRNGMTLGVWQASIKVHTQATAFVVAQKTEYQVAWERLPQAEQWARRLTVVGDRDLCMSFTDWMNVRGTRPAQLAEFDLEWARHEVALRKIREDLRVSADASGTPLPALADAAAAPAATRATPPPEPVAEPQPAAPIEEDFMDVDGKAPDLTPAQRAELETRRAAVTTALSTLLLYPHPKDQASSKGHPVLQGLPLTDHFRGSVLFAFAGPSRSRGQDMEVAAPRSAAAMGQLAAAQPQDYFYGILGRDPENRSRVQNAMVEHFPAFKDWTFRKLVAPVIQQRDGGRGMLIEYALFGWGPRAPKPFPPLSDAGVIHRPTGTFAAGVQGAPGPPPLASSSLCTVAPHPLVSHATSHARQAACT